MENNLIQTEVDIKGNTIKFLRINGYEYISLTDLARYRNPTDPSDGIKNG